MLVKHDTGWAMIKDTKKIAEIQRSGAQQIL
jgi:hypothetical protein